MKHLSMNCFLTPLDHNNKSFERDTALILVGINNKFTILFFVFIVINLIIYKAEAKLNVGCLVASEIQRSQFLVM